MCFWYTYLEGKQLFRQYDKFNQNTFLDYLKQAKKKLGKKVVIFTDRARQHQSNKVMEYLEKNKNSIRMLYLPKGSPEFNAVEECTGGRENMILLVSKYYPKFTDLKLSIAKYYRTRRFNLDIVKYLLRKVN